MHIASKMRPPKNEVSFMVVIFLERKRSDLSDVTSLGMANLNSSHCRVKSQRLGGRKKLLRWSATFCPMCSLSPVAVLRLSSKWVCFFISPSLTRPLIPKETISLSKSCTMRKSSNNRDGEVLLQVTSWNLTTLVKFGIDIASYMREIDQKIWTLSPSSTSSFYVRMLTAILSLIGTCKYRPGVQTPIIHLRHLGRIKMWFPKPRRYPVVVVRSVVSTAFVRPKANAIGVSVQRDISCESSWNILNATTLSFMDFPTTILRLPLVELRI